MAAGLSANADLAIAKSFFGFTSGALVVPTAIGISLHSAAIGNNKVIVSEWTNGGAGNTNYTARLSAGVDTANWNAAAFVSGTGVIVTNKILLAFSALTGTGGTLASIGLNDSLTIGSGNLNLFADVTSTPIAAGIVIQFNIGDITYTFF